MKLKLFLLVLVIVLGLGGCQRRHEPYGGKGSAANNPAYTVTEDVNQPPTSK